MKRKPKNVAVSATEGVKDVLQNFEDISFAFPDPNEIDWPVQAIAAGASKGAWLLHLVQKYRGQGSPRVKVLIESMLCNSSRDGMQRIMALGAALQIQDWKEQGIIRPTMELPEPKVVIEELLRSESTESRHGLVSKVMAVYHDHFCWMCLDSSGADTLLEGSDDDKLASGIAQFLLSSLENQHG